MPERFMIRQSIDRHLEDAVRFANSALHSRHPIRYLSDSELSRNPISVAIHPVGVIPPTSQPHAKLILYAVDGCRHIPLLQEIRAVGQVQEPSGQREQNTMAAYREAVPAGFKLVTSREHANVLPLPLYGEAGEEKRGADRVPIGYLQIGLADSYLCPATGQAFVVQHVGGYLVDVTGKEDHRNWLVEGLKISIILPIKPFPSPRRRFPGFAFRQGVSHGFVCHTKCGRETSRPDQVFQARPAL